MSSGKDWKEKTLGVYLVQCVTIPFADEDDWSDYSDRSLFRLAAILSTVRFFLIGSGFGIGGI